MASKAVVPPTTMAGIVELRTRSEYDAGAYLNLGGDLRGLGLKKYLSPSIRCAYELVRDSLK